MACVFAVLHNARTICAHESVCVWLGISLATLPCVVVVVLSQGNRARAMRAPCAYDRTMPMPFYAAHTCAVRCHLSLKHRCFAQRRRRRHFSMLAIVFQCYQCGRTSICHIRLWNPFRMNDAAPALLGLHGGEGAVIETRTRCKSVVSSVGAPLAVNLFV